MSLSAKKRTRRIRRAWAAWWCGRPVLDTYTDYGALRRYMTEKIVKVPAGCTCEVPGSECRSHPWCDVAVGVETGADYEPTPRPDPAKYEIGEYVVGVDLAGRVTP